MRVIIENGQCQIEKHLYLHFLHFQWKWMEGNTVQELHGNKNITEVLYAVFMILPHPSSLLTPDSHLVCSFSHKEIFISEDQVHCMLFCFILFYFILFYFILFYFILFCFVLFHFISCHIVLFCSILFSSFLSSLIIFPFCFSNIIYFCSPTYPIQSYLRLCVFHYQISFLVSYFLSFPLLFFSSTLLPSQILFSSFVHLILMLITILYTIMWWLLLASSLPLTNFTTQQQSSHSQQRRPRIAKWQYDTSIIRKYPFREDKNLSQFGNLLLSYPSSPVPTQKKRLKVYFILFS